MIYCPTETDTFGVWLSLTLNHGLLCLQNLKFKKTRGEHQMSTILKSSGDNVGLVKECAFGVLVETWWRYGPVFGNMSGLVAD